MKKISSAHWLLVIIAAVQLLLSVGLSLLVRLNQGNLYIPIWLQLLLSPLSMLIPFVFYCIITKRNPFTVIRFKKVKISSIVLGVLVMIFSYPVIVLLNLISMMFVDNAMASVLPDVLSIGLPAAVFFMAVVPAIVEETIFRGCLYNTYSKVRPVAGIFLSGLLFGLMHMNFNQMPYAFFLGIILALMLEATDSIITPMIMHFSLNAFTTILSSSSAAALQGQSAGTADLNEILYQAYRQSLSSQSISEGMTQSQIDQMAADMVPMALGIMMGILAVIAIVALVIVLALVYAAFAVNGRKPKEILLASPKQICAGDETFGGQVKNRMIDVPVIIFIVYALIQCVLSAIL